MSTIITASENYFESTPPANRPLASASPEELQHAYTVCADIVRQSAGNFYYSFIFLSKEQRRGIESLYAFCRFSDDLADSLIVDCNQSRFACLRERLELSYNGYFSDPLTLALADSVVRFGLEKQPFDDLLIGLESDLSVTRYETFDETRLYCYRVASTVGLLCLKVFGCDTPRTREYAVLHGIGMQLVNIIRDVQEDYDRGRIYIPLEDLVRFGLTPERLFDPPCKPLLNGLMHFQAERARQYLDQAAQLVRPEDKRPLVVARIIGEFYRKILEKVIKQAQYDRRIELPIWEKLKIARRVYADKK